MGITYNIKSEERVVRNLGDTNKVGLWGLLWNKRIDMAIILDDTGSAEKIKTLNLESLLEGDAILAGQAAGLDLGLALDSDAQSLVIGEPDVEGSEGVHVSDVDLLADIDSLVLVTVGGREVDGNEGGVRLEVLEVHDTLEAVDVGLDGAVGGDGGVDLHQVGVALGAEDIDALDLEVGIVKLVLGDLGNSNKDAGGGNGSALGSFQQVPARATLTLNTRPKRQCR